MGVPSRALVLTSRAVPSVAAGPADRDAWDKHLDPLVAREGEDGEARARAHRVATLPPQLAGLYREVRRMRELGSVDLSRLLAIAREAAQFPEDWLLRQEVAEFFGKGDGGAHPD